MKKLFYISFLLALIAGGLLWLAEYNYQLAKAAPTEVFLPPLNCTANANGGALTADTNGKVTCTDDDSGAGGGSPGAWELKFPNALGPTSTLAGIFVNASSTFDSTLRLNGALTVTPTASSTFTHSLVVDTSSLVVNANENRVGIGTASPSQKLQVQSGDVLIQYTAGGTSAYFMSDAVQAGDEASIGGLKFLNDTTEVARIAGISNGISRNASHLSFQTKTSAGSLTEKFRIQDDGNIGIGTASPTTTLGVVGSTRFNGAVTITDGLTINNITGSTQCLNVDTNGLVSGTGAACGSGSSGSPGAWERFGATNVLTPTSTAAGILVNAASSTITTLTVNDLVCTDCLNASEIEDIYLFNSGDTATGLMILPDLRASVLNASTTMISTLNLSGGLIINYFGTACSGNQWLQDIADNGAFTCTSLDTSGSWTGTLDGFEGAALAVNPGSWEKGNGAWLSPTSTANGIFVSASSTIDAHLKVGGRLTASSTLLIDGQILASSGTVSLPGLTFGADPDTGLFWTTANRLDLAAGGLSVGIFTSASSTILNNFNIGGNASTTGNFVVGTDSDTSTSTHVIGNNNGTRGGCLQWENVAGVFYREYVNGAGAKVLEAGTCE